MNDLVPMNDLQAMAAAVAKSGLFGAKTPDQALALMLVAQAEGLHPASAARDYDIIQGKGAKKSEAMLRDFLKSGGAVKWHKLDDTMADATFTHPAGGEVRITWDMKRAQVAGLSSKDMYKKFPRQMLRARCVSEGVRTVCPMATGGMYTPEEVQDIPQAQERDMGAAVVVEQEPAKPAGPPAYADADFAEDIKRFAKLVASGKKTAADILTMVSTKVVPSEAQKAAILALKKDEGGAPAITFAQVEEKLRECKDPDLLDAHADLIRMVTDAKQREDLTAIYHERKAELEGGK